LFASQSDYPDYVGECEADLIDRRTFFEKNVFTFVGQVILYLFGLTSLFK